MCLTGQISYRGLGNHPHAQNQYAVFVVFEDAQIRLRVTHQRRTFQSDGSKIHEPEDDLYLRYVVAKRHQQVAFIHKLLNNVNISPFC